MLLTVTLPIKYSLNLPTKPSGLLLLCVPSSSTDLSTYLDVSKNMKFVNLLHLTILNTKEIARGEEIGKVACWQQSALHLKSKAIAMKFNCETGSRANLNAKRLSPGGKYSTGVSFS